MRWLMCLRVHNLCLLLEVSKHPTNNRLYGRQWLGPFCCPSSQEFKTLGGFKWNLSLILSFILKRFVGIMSWVLKGPSIVHSESVCSSVGLTNSYNLLYPWSFLGSCDFSFFLKGKKKKRCLNWKYAFYKYLIQIILAFGYIKVSFTICQLPMWPGKPYK